ncbi:hypothetical protein O7623_01555 [Solwaraspora sp. WMMD791]|uniref:hypothetical protein n=1 Tax=Solwaraspora sp. WMMD791 TaxID=3016086 RepID=UPI00249C432F|nr:hypothetical protein [Solwaraspora sp. WMMD791]WFE27921.1 hypothetical protein O7623_01555 [Solwaraspora sp. WMMD791]
MDTSTDLDALTDFFDRYGAAVTAGDIPELAACFASPAMVVADTYSFSFSSPAAVALSFVGAAADYQVRRIVAAHTRFHDVRQVSAALVAVEAEWEYLDAEGRSVPGRRFHYLLRVGRDGVCICTVTPLD